VKKSLDETTALLRDAGAVRPPPPGAPRLVMLAGPDLGQRIDLAEGELTIGRESRCGVVLPLGGVSRVHCSIRRDASGIWLRDLGSTNGTRRNGETAPAHQDVRLQVGDLVAIGGAIFKLLDAESPESEYHEQVFRTMALDGLTQVRNRRSLQDALESEIARSRRHQHALSLLLLDVDRFKEVNDRHGHLCGDNVLQRIAALLGRHGRRENCTARYGGDEFAIVLAETALAGAMIFAERVRGAVEHEEIRVGDERVGVTVSVGVAEWSPQMGNPDDLIALADTALYRAKNGGRNRVSR
jgi:diguanylate cyclase (GGDEF)-like protein